MLQLYFTNLSGLVFKFGYLVFDEGVDSLQHPLTGELVWKVGLNLEVRTHVRRESTSAASDVWVFTLPLRVCVRVRVGVGWWGVCGGGGGGSSWSLVDSGPPQITKHMSLRWLVW